MASSRGKRGEVPLPSGDLIWQQLEASSGKAAKINPMSAQQIQLFPETNPLLDELKAVDINSLSPIEALNKIYEWQRKYIEKKG